MAKKKTGAQEKGLFENDIKKLQSVIKWDQSHDRIVIIIPSHDRKNNRRNDQHEWADAAMRLCGTLYGGATAFTALKGIFKTDEGEMLHDEPLLVQSYAARQSTESADNLRQLLEFMDRMGRETKQYAVALIFNGYLHIMKIAKGR